MPSPSTVVKFPSSVKCMQGRLIRLEFHIESIVSLSLACMSDQITLVTFMIWGFHICKIIYKVTHASLIFGNFHEANFLTQGQRSHPYAYIFYLRLWASCMHFQSKDTKYLFKMELTLASKDFVNMVLICMHISEIS